jgi:rSAM/selenodomain-associated transferase 1
MRFHMTSDALLVFVRVPKTGRVKTRLAGAVGPKQACRLYRLFVEDLLAGLSMDQYDTVICYDPPDGKEEIASWLGSAFDYQAQQGSSLGEKMAHAFAWAFAQGSARTVLIGSDIPDLNAAVIEQAFAGLNTHESVMGPTVDGGYYLIGFSAAAFCPQVFRSMPWGTPRVFHDTMNVLKAEKLSVRVLSLFRDIDRIEDLADLLERARRKPELNNLNTLRYLIENPELLEVKEKKDCNIK